MIFYIIYISINVLLYFISLYIYICNNYREYIPIIYEYIGNQWKYKQRNKEMDKQFTFFVAVAHFLVFLPLISSYSIIFWHSLVIKLFCSLSFYQFGDMLH